MTWIIAFALGAVCAWLAIRWIESAREIADRTVDRLAPSAPIAAIRWEATGVDLTDGPVRHLRRHRPTHDLLTNVPFLQVVRPKGNAAAVVSRRCASWLLPIVMVERRSGRIERVVLLNGDPDLGEKHGILRRTSVRTIVIAPDADEREVVTALAA